MNKRKFYSLLLVLLMIGASSVFAQRNATNTKKGTEPKITDKDLQQITDKSEPLVQQTDKGVINWTEQYIEATGMSAIDTTRFKLKAQAKLMARRGAMVDAQRNLLEIINGVRVVGETKVEDMIATKDYIYTRVDGIVKGAQPVSEPREEDGIMIVTLRIPMYEKDGLAPAVVDRPQIAKPEERPALDDVKNTEVKEDAATTESTPAMAFNLNGKSYDPALFPLVVDENGEILADFSKIYDPQKGKFPKILKSTKEALELAGMKKGVDVIDVISAQDGKLVVSTEMKKKFNWDKVLSTAGKVSKFLLLFV